MAPLLGFAIGKHYYDQAQAGSGVLENAHSLLANYAPHITGEDPESSSKYVQLQQLVNSTPASKAASHQFQNKLNKGIQGLDQTIQAWRQMHGQNKPPQVPQQSASVASQPPARPQGNPQTIAPLAAMQQAPAQQMAESIPGLPPPVAQAQMAQELTPPPGMAPRPESRIAHVAHAMGIGQEPVQPIGPLSNFDPFGAAKQQMSMDIGKRKAELDAMYGAMSELDRQKFQHSKDYAAEMMQQMSANAPDMHLKLKEVGGKYFPEIDNGQMLPGQPIPENSFPQGTLKTADSSSGLYALRRYSIPNAQGIMYEAIPREVAKALGWNESGGATLTNRVTGATTNGPAVRTQDLATRQFNLGNGGIGTMTVQQLRNISQGNSDGSPAQVPGAINNRAIGTTSTTTAPGAAPVTTRRTPVLPGVSSSATVPPPPVQAAAQAVTRQSDSFPPYVKTQVEAVAAGRPIPSGKDGNMVMQYMREHGHELPIVLSEGGQKALASVDPVLEEIQRTKTMLEDAVKKGLTQGQLAKSWALYQVHQDSPQTALISNMSFSALRSAVSALQGSGSRAYPVLKMALEHTPSALGDPKRSLTLLKEMENRVTQARKFVIEDERKGGVVPSLTVPPGGKGTVKMKAPTGETREVQDDQVDHFKRMGATVVQ